MITVSTMIALLSVGLSMHAPPGEEVTPQPGDLPFERIQQKANQLARDLSLGFTEWRPKFMMTYRGERRQWVFGTDNYELLLDSRTGDLVRLSLTDGSHSVRTDSRRTGLRHFASDEDAKMELRSIANKLGVWPNAKMRYAFHPDDPTKSLWGYYFANFKPDLGPYQFYSLGPQLVIGLDSETGRIVEIEQDREYEVTPTEIRVTEAQAKDLAWRAYSSYCSDKGRPLRATKDEADVVGLGYAVPNGWNGSPSGFQRAPYQARLVYRVRFGPATMPGFFDHVSIRADTGQVWGGYVSGVKLSEELLSRIGGGLRTRSSNE